MPADHPLASHDLIRRDDLLEIPLVTMRTGYAMHRYLHRFFGDAKPSLSYAADGADMGKTMVAQDLGVTILPDYSVISDPLMDAIVITLCEIEDDATVRLEIHRRPDAPRAGAAADLHKMFIELAGAGPPTY